MPQPDWLDTLTAHRTRWRGALLPAFALPLLPAAFLNLLGGHGGQLLGTLAGLALPWGAAWFLRRGRRGDTRNAALTMAGAVGLTALLGADHGIVASALLAGLAGLGTWMLYDELPEAAPPPPPPPPPPPEPALVAEARARLARVQGAAARLADPRLAGVAGALGGVLDDLARRPDRLPMARRFLNVHLDGVERIAQRLEAGALPPEGLPALLAELDRAALELRGRLQREESEALEVQVKVLSDRLRQEGYGA